MKLLIGFAFLAANALAKPATSGPFEGRWDLTVHSANQTYPSWMEVTGQAVRVNGRVSSVHPAKDVTLKGGSLTFATSEWFGKMMPVSWTLHAAAGKLTGSYKREDGVEATLTGTRAPALNRSVASWGKPEPLFDGKDLAGWAPFTTEPGKTPVNHWVVRDGELVNEAPGANIRTTRTFNDFKLHVEFNCPEDGNSGVYLRGRDEIQVAYEKDDDLHGMGAIYGFIAPAVKLPRQPGQWETFDVTLTGRHVTVVRDGQTTIDNQEIPGITGGALDSHEAEPGPIYLQGDHTGGMRYRNLTIALPAR